MLADRQVSERPPFSASGTNAERGEQQPMGARGVISPQPSRGAGRAQVRAALAPRRTLCGIAASLAGLGQATGTTEEATATVPIPSAGVMRAAAHQAVPCKRDREQRVSAAEDPPACRARDGTGCRCDRRPFGGYCCARASAAAQRNDARPAHLAGLATRPHWGAGASACRMEPVDVAL